jgi:hypothetical protein
MIAWQEIGLPAGYSSWPPSRYGIANGDLVMETNNLIFTIESSFVFSDDGHLKVYGYAFNLPTTSQRSILDGCVSQLNTCWGGVPIPGLERIGDASGAIEIQLGSGIQTDVLMFRLQDVGAAVFLRHPSDQPPPVDLHHLARVYHDSLRNPAMRCELVSAIPVAGHEWPTYDLTAAGFYPGEGRMVFLYGDVQIGGDLQNSVTALAGLEGQSFDLSGARSEVVAFSQVVGDNVVLPGEIQIKVVGVYSDCVAGGTYSWPEGEYLGPLDLSLPQISDGTEGGLASFHEDFNATLDPDWAWIRAEDDQWSVTNNPGRLEVSLTTATQADDPGPETLLLRWIEGENFEILTQMHFDPDINFQRAGLVIYQNRDNYVALLRGYADVGMLPGKALYLENLSETGASFWSYGRPLTDGPGVYLKLRRVGMTYSAFCSLDGISWDLLGEIESPIEPVSYGLLIGKSVVPITADFEFFEFRQLP